MTVVPDLMPVLSAGKHRSPKAGGCFMEFASFLAGEPWSDHPKCTDPTLAELARSVNDVMPDSARSRLSPMIPSVIGTGRRSSTERTEIAARVVRDCALMALPLVSLKTRPLACALLVAERVLDESSVEATAALTSRPEAWAFALRWLSEHPRGWRDRRGYLSLAAPQALRCAVRSLSEELGPEAPEVLGAMLARAIDTTRTACGLGDGEGVSDQRWQSPPAAGPTRFRPRVRPEG